MKKLLVLGVLAIAWMVSMTGEARANPTGSPLVSYPVEPCRFLDTRVGGAPLAGGVGMDVYVRGAKLQSSDGALQSDCGVPASAESVKVNLTIVGPTSNGYLKVNGTGFVQGPRGAYSRVTYRATQNTSNEIEVSLCNSFLAPFAHEPCPNADEGRYSDFQIQNMGIGSVHIVGDVVGYLQSLPPD